MNKSKGQKSCQYEIFESKRGQLIIRFYGHMDASNAACTIQEITARLKHGHYVSMRADLEKVTYMDDFGALILVELKEQMLQAKGHFEMINVSDRIKEVLAILHFESLGRKINFTKPSIPGVFVRLGEATLRFASDLKYLIFFLGSAFMGIIYVVFHPRSLRLDDTFWYMQKTGVDALPIVALISFLLGLIMAFMSSVQLKEFGANIYVASLVSLAMARELGPIMTAIIVAGRSGSAFAAEIGTMKINEEIDALFTMGFDTTRFLVVPKIIATVIVVPVLELFSVLFAIFGGLIVGVFMLNLTTNAYIAQTLNTLTLFDVFWGFSKSAVFGLLIAWIGCLRGFQVKGGAASVGQATTSAVVSSIFLIILSDSIFSVILRYWG